MNIFISSTCYSNESRRDQIFQLIMSLNLRPIMSDQPNFPTHRDLHSHDICLEAIKYCDIVVLIIQKRYGGYYLGVKKEFKGISITHAEYREAIKLNKKIVILSELEISKYKQIQKTNPRNPELKNYIHSIELFNEVTRAKTNNWIDQFANTKECLKVLKLKLINLKNENICKENGNFKAKLLNLITNGNNTNVLTILSFWTIHIDNWFKVKKIWKIKLVNNSQNDIRLKGLLYLPIPYEDAFLLSTDYKTTRNRKVTAVNNISTSFEFVGNPLHSNALKFDIRNSLILHRKESIDLQVEFEHSGYFRNFGDLSKFSSGIINYLDFPPISSNEQLVCKEFHIEKSLLIDNGESYSISFSEKPDWKIEHDTKYIYGFYKKFNNKSLKKIDIAFNKL